MRYYIMHHYVALQLLQKCNVETFYANVMQKYTDRNKKISIFIIKESGHIVQNRSYILWNKLLNIFWVLTLIRVTLWGFLGNIAKVIHIFCMTDIIAQ